MKKKIYTLLVVLLSLSACSNPAKIDNNQVTENESKEKSIKLEEEKDYAYVTEEKTYTLGTPNSENTGVGNFLKNIYGIPEPFKSEKITINVNSEDARRVEGELSHFYEENYSQVQYSEDGSLVEGHGFVLYKIEETKHTISISVLDYGYLMHSDSFGSDLLSYVFNKENGELLTNDEIFASLNITEEDVMNKIQIYCDEHNLIIGDGSEYLDPSIEGPDITIINKSSYFVTKDNQLFVELYKKGRWVGPVLPFILTLDFNE